MPVSYISQLDYLNTPSGLETGTLLGNSLRLSSAVAAGATSLPVVLASGLTGTSFDLNQFDPITIYDGLSSEVVLVSAATTFPATSIPIMAPIGATYTGCQFAHAQYIPLSSPGTLGDIGQEILKASAWLENITKQSLWQTTQTETLRLPSMRASIDGQNILTFRLRQYPITAVNTLSMGTNQSNIVSYDPTQAFIGDGSEIVTVPQLNTTGTGSSTYSLIAQIVSRRQNAYLLVNYTAGYTASNMPADIKQAAMMLVSHLLTVRDNPAGADSIREGNASIQATQRGDTSGDSLHVKNAKALLANYALRMF